jgi:hypothetical protein
MSCMRNTRRQLERRAGLGKRSLRSGPIKREKTLPYHQTQKLMSKKRKLIVALASSLTALSGCTTGTSGGYPFRPIAVHQTPQQKAAIQIDAQNEAALKALEAQNQAALTVEAQKQAALKAAEAQKQYAIWYSNLTPQEQAQEDQRQAQEDRDQVQREIEWDLSNIASSLESY